jgi:hypothetical protein
MKFLRRKIRLLGLSVPVWGIAAFLVVTGVAVAAFANLLAVNMSITAKSGPEGTFSGLTCNFTLAGPGVVDSCTLNGDGTATIEVSGIDDNSQLVVAVDYTPSNFDQVYNPTYPDPLPSGISLIEEKGAAVGTVFTVGNAGNISQKIYFEDIVPDQVLSGIVLEYQFTEN